MLKVFIGWDTREQEAYDVCVHTLKKHCSQDIEIIPIKKHELMKEGLYTRPQPEAGSVEFTYTRFLVPYLCNYKGWGLFIDCDFLFTKDVAELFSLKKNRYAVMCVHHDYTPKASLKMDGQKQVTYPRKNWSSCMLFNCSHISNKMLTPEVVSSESGAWLHRFKWLHDNQIGGLPEEWNWLEGEYEKPDIPPAVIHYTNGGPWFENCQDVDYADLWREAYEEATKIR